ncbi:hypothetical protein LJB85_03200 [Porphyromonadaceae bacterium OttesenSCG-928-L07]|nr:hypothetical protein [Porphyromonadaceae bacterium OttesenSCG-928-L07]MDL2251974.1 hypothetical protein [Odoribacter sp. OttesenSCG-928-J03]
MKLLKILFVLTLFSVVFTACDDDDDNTPKGDVKVSFESLVANGSATETTTALTLQFSEEIAGLTADDITLTSGEIGAVKGALTAKGNGAYELAVSNVLSAGDISVSVAKTGYAITPDSKTVTLFYHDNGNTPGDDINVSFESLVANGSETETTTALTLQFSAEITGLTVDDITLTSGEIGAIKDSLTAKDNGVYELAVSNVLSAGDVSVSVAKTGYVITPDSKTVTLFYYDNTPAGDVDVSFESLVANGSASETTTVLTLQFSAEITDLTADDITLTSGETGAVKGELTAKGNGAYELAVSTVLSDGDVSVSVAKTGYVITPDSKTVAVFYHHEGPNVYAVGYEWDADANNIATLWVNGKAQVLDGTIDSWVQSVFVSGNDVYVAGHDGRVATLWKNGVAQPLTDGTKYALPVSVFVSGNDVYTAGYEVNAGGKQVATLWKNNVPQSLTDGIRLANATSVFVSGNDVYVVGIEENASGFHVPFLWKNAVPQSLTDGTKFAMASSVFVSGSDVYIAGNEGNSAVLWKNGVPQSLTAGSTPAAVYSVSVSGNDVYAVGYEKNAANMGVATLWKNGVPQPLTDGTNDAVAYSVFVFDNDVYVAGYETEDGVKMATLWKNGVPQVLSTNFSEANSVFVAQ